MSNLLNSDELFQMLFMMIRPSVTIYLLPLLVWSALGLEDTRLNPVDVLQTANLVIENYRGPLNSDTFDLFQNVEYLLIRRSNITSLNVTFIQDLPKLKSLEISQNNIGHTQLNFTECCANLESITLDDNNFNELENIVKQIGTVASLKYLYLGYENLPTLKKNALTNPKLEELTINACKLGTIEDGAFKSLNQLVYLNLRNNRLGWIEKEVLAPLVNIKRINLEGNSFIELSTVMFPPLPNLEELIFSFNNLKLINLEGVKTVAPKLKTVDINGFIKVRGQQIRSGGVKLEGSIMRVNS